jgi:hypothetical protein
LRKYLIFGALVVLAGIVINYSLGGFKKIEPELISTHSTVIYGSLYEGGHSSDSLTNLIAQFHKILTASGQTGTLTIVNYKQEKLEKRGLVKQFVGIEWQKNVNNIKPPLDSIFISPYNGFQFRLPIKPLVMPSPEKLKKLAQEAALLNDGELQDYSIEQYHNQLLIINFPLK